MLCARLYAESFPCVLSFHLHNNLRDMKCQDLQLQMSQPRLREVKGLAPGHTVVTGHTRILTVKLMLRGSLPATCQRAKILHTMGGCGLPLEGPKSMASFPSPHQGHGGKHLQKTKTPREKALAVNSPLGVLWGCAHRLWKRGCRNLNYFAHGLEDNR